METIACLCIDERRCDKLGESDKTVTRIRGERRPVLRGADREDAPDGAVDDHRHPDDRTDAKRAGCLTQWSLDAAVVLDPSRSARSDHRPDDSWIAGGDGPRLAHKPTTRRAAGDHGRLFVGSVSQEAGERHLEKFGCRRCDRGKTPHLAVRQTRPRLQPLGVPAARWRLVPALVAPRCSRSRPSGRRGGHARSRRLGRRSSSAASPPAEPSAPANVAGLSSEASSATQLPARGMTALSTSSAALLSTGRRSVLRKRSLLGDAAKLGGLEGSLREPRLPRADSCIPWLRGGGRGPERRPDAHRGPHGAGGHGASGVCRLEIEPAPILMGHSAGGVFMQLLMDPGYGAAGVAINSAPTEGVKRVPLSQIRSSFPVLRTPPSGTRPWVHLRAMALRVHACSVRRRREGSTSATTSRVGPHVLGQCAREHPSGARRHARGLQAPQLCSPLSAARRIGDALAQSWRAPAKPTGRTRDLQRLPKNGSPLPKPRAQVRFLPGAFSAAAPRAAT